ncbi:MAG TPA: DUF2283 domain-containing protein [Thermoanaerobaculia bacterium]|nr:DUF2283 domain-containing protein [Thermoanaerobaculia bacterium]
MRVTLDERSDLLSIVLNDHRITGRDRENPGVVLEYDRSGGLVAIQIRDASRWVERPNDLVYQLVAVPDGKRYSPSRRGGSAYAPSEA